MSMTYSDNSFIRHNDKFSKINIPLFIFISLIFSRISSLYAQTYTIDDFSKQYCVKVIFFERQQVDGHKNASLIIRNKINGKEVLHLTGLQWTSDNMSDNSSILAYAEQGFFIYDDFNFDGQKDFAIWDTVQACYGGKSYKIFLKNKLGLKYNPYFTNLTKAPFCGIFKIDRKNRQIETFSKSGCCEQTVTYYRVISDTITLPVKKISVKFDPEDSIVKKKTFYFEKGKLK